MSSTEIPFLDLIRPHVDMEEELVAVFRAALQTAAFIGGKAVRDFEAAFAEFCEVDHCVGVGSGTDALRFALMAAGVRTGDSVLTVPNTFIATAEAISQAGAQPEFVDIDECTYNIDPEKLREHLETEVRSRSTVGKASVPPHRPNDYGNCTGASLRANGGYGSHFGAGAVLQSAGGRRRMPGAWGRVFFAK